MAVGLMVLSGFSGLAQKLEISGQKNLSVDAGKPITLQLTDFTVKGSGEGQYPTDFKLEVFDGDGYSVSGTTVTPDAGFTGTLEVIIKISRVKDGETKAETERTKIKVQVKAVSPPPATPPPSTPPPATPPPASQPPPTVEKLTVTGQRTLSTPVNTPITLRLSDFTIDGPGENEYPNGFSLEVFGGANYSRSGSTITPDGGFKGTLSVEIKITRIKEGKIIAESDNKAIKIEVKEAAATPPANTPPKIIGQKSIRIFINETAAIGFDHLTVVDPDNNYPTGFTIRLSDGPNYTVASGNKVVPVNGFTGTLIVKTVVNDGKADSPPFDFKISVVEENTQEPPPTTSGAPVFVNFSENQLGYSLGNKQFLIAREIEIDDPDSEELFYAEIYFDAEGFVAGKDQLAVETSGNISSVFDADVGMLVIFGRESLTLYQQALRSIRYNFASDSMPSVTQKRVHFRLNDGENSSATKTKSIRINETITLDIPNVFTPNDDAAHDVWVIRPSRDVENIAATVRVFDKRGVLIFETNDLSKSWDGRSDGSAVPAGLYYYTIEVAAGVSRIRHQGVVTILR